MVVTNTYRHTSEKPRFRVIIPTTQSMTPDAYRIIYECIASKLEEAGYAVTGRNRKSRYAPTRKSGLDWGKRAPTSLFNAPCQTETLSQSFFQTYTEPCRNALDPSTWIENSAYLIQPEPEFAEPTSEPSREVDQGALDVAVEKWRTSPSHPGEGGTRFFNLALDLRSAGMSRYDIEGVLVSEAPNGRSPNERKAQIPSIMNSLQRRGHRHSRYPIQWCGH
jgi:hypothetical protein